MANETKEVLATPVRKGTIDTGSQGTEVFPVEAFKFDPPSESTPDISLQDPWRLNATNSFADTAANLASANPVLPKGWIGFETDTEFFKIGDGATAWTSLSYQRKRAFLAGGVIYEEGKWYAYPSAPSFTGFGTPTGVLAVWKREGGSLKARITFASGTSTGVEGRIGLPLSLTSHTTLTPTLGWAGTWATDANSGSVWNVLTEPNKGYVTFGYGSGVPTAGLAKQNANNFASAGQKLSMNFEVIVNEWN